MSEILKSHLHPRHLEIDENEVFSKSDFKSGPIKMIEDCHLAGEMWTEGKLIKCAFDLVGTLTLEDSYTAELFKEEVALSEDFDILEEEDGEGEGFIVPGPTIDLKEIALSLFRFNLPIKILKPGSKLPKGGEGWNVLSEDEIENGDEENHSSPFDKLKDLDL